MSSRPTGPGEPSSPTDYVWKTSRKAPENSAAPRTITARAKMAAGSAPEPAKPKPVRVHPQGATPPFPDRSPKRLALRASDAANTTFYLGEWAHQITLVFERNRWLWLPIWVVLCLLIATTWDVGTIRAVFDRVDAPPPPTALEATASTTWGRLGVTVLVSLPIVSIFRLMYWLTRKSRRA